MEAVKSALGKKITSVKIEDDRLKIMFSDGSGIGFWDSGQSCCESRYMTMGDKPEDFVGAEFVGAELREAPNVPSEDEHEIEFLVVLTSKGNLTVSNHNEHNGYYGGFDVEAFKI